MSLKGSLKAAIAAAWDAGRRLVPRGPRLTILYYHAVPPEARAAFDAQMAWLARHANVVAADHVGALAADRPSVAVTFDDAFRSVRENALPALERHGVTATIFVPTGYLGRPPGWAMETEGDRAETVMSEDEIKALPARLIAIGSHTVDHPHLSQLTPADTADQLASSRAALEALIGRPVDTLAFPYGDHDGRVVEQASAAGYRFVYTVAPQSILPGDQAIRRGRTSTNPTDPISLFALKARGAYEWMPLASALKRALHPR